MTKFKKYENYKKTDLDWLGEIPSHWEILPNRAIFKERNTRNCTNEELLSVTIKQGVIKQSKLLEDTSKKDSSNEDKSKYKLVKINDIAYNKMRMWQGAVGVSDYQGIVSPAYIILNPIVGINSKYFHYLYRSSKYIQYSYNYSYGICDDQLSLRYKDFSKMYSIMPPIEEQNKIVNFIEYKEKQINKLINKQKKLINLLEEKKKIAINNVVLKGINKNQTKKSDIDYIEQIPQSWNIYRLKYVLKERNIRSTTGKEELLSVSQKYGIIPTKQIVQKTMQANNLIGYKKVFKNDLIFNKLNPALARFGVSNWDGITSPDFAIYYTDDKKNNVSYFCHLFKTDNYVAQFKKYATGVGDGFMRLYTNSLFKIKVTVPPFEDQNLIVNEIYNITNNIQTSVSIKQNFIDKLEEYKKNLISFTVTGQIDIRNYEIPAINDTIDLEEFENISEDDIETISEVEYANN